jgi:hypothetical protein
MKIKNKKKMNDFLNFYSTVYYQKKIKDQFNWTAPTIGGVATTNSRIRWFVVAFHRLQ